MLQDPYFNDLMKNKCNPEKHCITFCLDYYQDRVNCKKTCLYAKQRILEGKLKDETKTNSKDL
jgi:hypothetical protein